MEGEVRQPSLLRVVRVACDQSTSPGNGDWQSIPKRRRKSLQLLLHFGVGTHGVGEAE
jgi:hypothetical protein